MKSSRVLGLLAAGVMAGAGPLAAGCGEDTVDAGKLEEEIQEKLGVTVSCPDDVTFDECKKFSCEGQEFSVNPGTPAPGQPSTPPTTRGDVVVEVTLTGDDSATFLRTK